MLNKSFRLTKNKEFDQVFKVGHSFFGAFLGIKVLKNNKNKKNCLKTVNKKLITFSVDNIDLFK